MTTIDGILTNKVIPELQEALGVTGDHEKMRNFQIRKEGTVLTVRTEIVTTNGIVSVHYTKDEGA